MSFFLFANWDWQCRVNISNAVIFGLKDDLHIVNGTKYNTALTIFFVPYIIFELPSNVLLKRLKPHVWRMCLYLYIFPMIFFGSSIEDITDMSSANVYVRIRTVHVVPGTGQQLGRADGDAILHGCF